MGSHGIDADDKIRKQYKEMDKNLFLKISEAILSDWMRLKKHTFISTEDKLKYHDAQAILNKKKSLIALAPSESRSDNARKLYEEIVSDVEKYNLQYLSLTQQKVSIF